MAQHYTDPKRAKDAYSLPDLEVWQEPITIVSCPRCGDFEIPTSHAFATADLYCPSCEREIESDGREKTDRLAWWYWFCLPGCLPDSDVNGPFDTEDSALNDARESAGVEDENEHECPADEPTEPSEDDLTTTDHRVFRQYGKVAFALIECSDGSFRLAKQGQLLSSDTFPSVEAAVRAYMDRVQFWPNVWFISDHGNAHLIDLGVERQ